MRHPALEKLLILQDRDNKRLALKNQLEAVPKEVAATEQKIAAEKAAIEAAKAEWQGLEAKKKALENEIGSAETKLAKYRTQQASVRKNDEYKALGTEIENTQAEVSKLEEEELGVMYAIDEAKKRFQTTEVTLKQAIAQLEAKKMTLAERATRLQAEAKEAESTFQAARTGIDEPSLRIYDRVAVRTQPVLVALRAGKCGGCHLKVSSESESDARKGEKLATCDQCGRLLWFDL